MAGDLVKRSYSDAFWSKKSGRVLALEKIVLYGLTLSADRKINFEPIDPIESRRLFIQCALVSGETRATLSFLKHNQKLLADIETMEHRSRRLDILIDEQVQFDFYDQKIPDNVNNIRELEKWYCVIVKKDPKYLFFNREFLIRDDADEICDLALPETLSVSGVSLPLSYHFEPGAKDDGVSLSVPMTILSQLHPDRFDWLVPGLIKEKITELIRTLPKQLRRNFVPAPNFSEACHNSLVYAEGNLFEAITDHLKKITSIEIPFNAWDQTRLADHLRMNFKVIDINGKIIAEDRNLKGLQGKLVDQVKQLFSDETSWEIEQDNIKQWNFSDLPEMLETTKHGMPLRGYPALIDNGDSVSLRVEGTPEKAIKLHHAGLRRLIRLSLPEQMTYLQKKLIGFNKMSLQYSTIGNAEELKEDLIVAIIDRAFLSVFTDIRSEKSFQECLDKGRAELIPISNQLCESVGEILEQFHVVRKRFDGQTSLASLNVIKTIKDQMNNLVYPGFVSTTPNEWLQHLPRYLNAIEKRLDKFERYPAKDKALESRVLSFWSKFENAKTLSDSLIQFRWLIEEYRVSIFAQELRTSCPVSEKRLDKLWSEHIKIGR